MIQYNKERPLRVFTAFSGYDSQCLALDRLKETFPEFEYELVGWSEIDKYAIQAHNALYPQWADRNYGDISKIDWNKVPDFDLFTYSSPCFVAGTLIHTEDGFKPIEDVKVGDKVLTHANCYCEVEKTGSKSSDDIYMLKGSMFDIITCTGNHPFYARKMSRKGHNQERTFDTPEWIEAKDLNKNTYLGYAINKMWFVPGDNEPMDSETKSILNSEYFWYLIGRILGGIWKNDDRFVICRDETICNRFASALKVLGIHYRVEESKTVIRLGIPTSLQNQLLTKYICQLPPYMIERFIYGLVNSNGSYNNYKYEINTTNIELAYGLQQCIAKVFKRIAKISRNDIVHTHFTKLLIEVEKYQYKLVWHTADSSRDRSFYEDGYIWFPLKSVAKVDCNTIVYNLQVADNHSYTANGVIVHNCQDFSIAGLQKGGEQGSGTRSSLLWECRKAIENKRPRFALLENVKALVSKKFYPLFLDWVSTMVSLGYYNWWQVLNATDYESPQNRERVFLVSCLDNIQYQFPEPMELPYCVADILEYDTINDYRINKKTERDFIESLDMERLEKEARFADERGLTVCESEIDDEDV